MKSLIVFCLLASLKSIHSAEDLGIGPVFIWHGASECDEFESTQDLKKIFEEYGSLVKTVRIGETCFDDTIATYLDIDYQVKVVCDQLSNDTDLANGFTIVGLSQGGMLARALVQKCSTINVTSLVSFGAPHGANFGLPRCELLTSELYKLFCFVQKNVKDLFGFGRTGLTPFYSLAPNLAFASLWKDPYRQPPLYVNYVDSLNNLVNPNESYKTNLLKLKYFIAIYFNPDLAIYPPSSGRFDEYKQGTTDVVIPYNETEHYKKDLIGLRTLDETGRFIPLEVLGIHMDYESEWFIENVIKKYLAGQVTN